MAKALLAPEAAIGDGEVVGWETTLEMVPTAAGLEVGTTTGLETGTVALMMPAGLEVAATELTVVTGADRVHGQLVMVMVEDSVKVLV